MQLIEMCYWELWIPYFKLFLVKFTTASNAYSLSLSFLQNVRRTPNVSGKITFRLHFCTTCISVFRERQCFRQNYVQIAFLYYLYFCFSWKTVESFYETVRLCVLHFQVPGGAQISPTYAINEELRILKKCTDLSISIISSTHRDILDFVHH